MKTQNKSVRNKRNGEHTLSIPFFNRVTVKFMLTVGLVVAGLLASIFLYLSDRTQDRIISEVHKQAEIAFEQLVITRHWNTEYGGVYVEKVEGVESNPYLEKLGIAPDIISLDNRTYTLKNPSLMTRELSDISKKGKVLEFHITSLDLVNPANAPDVFEKKSLTSFEKGATAANQIVRRNGLMSYHYMAPLYVEKGCLKCHKNYTLGDVLGGISVFLPMQEAHAAIQATKRNLFAAGFGLIFGVEILLFFLISRLIVRPMNELRIGAMKIGAGNLDYRIPARGNDEIGALGNAFNTMASDTASNVCRVTESEEKFRAIFTGSPEGIALTDSESGAIFDCNSAFERQAGRELNHLKKMKIWEIMPPEKADAAKTNFHEIVKKGIGFSEELEFQKPDGKIIPIEFISNLVTIQGKRYILSMTRDLTERKQIEEDLRLYGHIVSTVPELLSFVDKDYIYRAVNKAYCRYHNKKAEDIVGKSVTDLHGENTFNEIIKPPLDRVLGGEEIAYDAWFDYAAMGRRYMAVEYYPYTEEDGKISGVVILAADITERKRLEDLLNTSKEQLQDLYDNAPDMYFSVKPDGTILSVNQFGAKCLGYTKDELIGGPVWIVVHKDDLPRVKNAILGILDKKIERFELEFRKVRKDGSAIYVHERAQLFLDEEGVPKELRIICRDISERKKIEDEIRRLNEKLEEKVAERTAELEEKNEQLEQFNKLFVGRELRMAELKERIEELEKELVERKK